MCRAERAISQAPGGAMWLLQFAWLCFPQSLALSSQHESKSPRSKSPVQVQGRIQDAWGWCTGMTQRDGIGREEGVGFRMGNMCIPVADSC